MTDGIYREFADDPVGFVLEVLGVQPWERQQEILLALREHRRVTVRSAHGVGKSWVAACAALWFLYTRDPVVVLTTAPTHRQVKEILWREIRRRHAAARLPLPGRVLETGLKLSASRFALGLSTDESDRFQGFHAPHLLVVVDEASGVPEEIFDAIDGVLTSGDCRLLLIGNPVQAAGRFYESHTKPGWRKVVISALDSPNVQGRDLDDPVALESADADHPGLVTARWVAERRQQWGEGSPLYQSRVLGNFPDQADDALISLVKIEAAIARGQVRGRGGQADGRGKGRARHARDLRWRASSPSGGKVVELGVDIARFGSCETVVYVRKGNRVVRGEAWHGADLMTTTGRIAALIRKLDPTRVKVDGAGLGAGVVDRLRELGFRQVFEVNVARAARQADRYASLRDELFFNLRDRFEDEVISLPDDEVLASQLAALRYSFTSRGQQKVESKDEMRARGLPSPDRADALALCFMELRQQFRPCFLVGRPRRAWPYGRRF